MLALGGLVAAACSGDDAGRGAGDEAEVAVEVCSHLRSWSNDVVALVNASSRAVTEADDATARAAILRTALDDLELLVRDLVDRTDELDLGNVDEADRLHRDLRAGAELALAVIEDERPRFEALETVDDDVEGVWIVQLFDVAEEIFAFTEPAIVGYENAALTDAITSETACENLLIVV